jgi:hypothetical protein
LFPLPASLDTHSFVDFVERMEVFPASERTYEALFMNYAIWQAISGTKFMIRWLSICWAERCADQKRTEILRELQSDTGPDQTAP